jgi:hypothetical protein
MLWLNQDLKICDHGTLIKILYFWTLSIVLFLSKTLSCIFKKHNVSETGFCFLLQVKPIQLGPNDNVIPYHRTPASTISCGGAGVRRYGLALSEDGNWIQCPKHYVLNKNRTMDYIQKHNISIMINFLYPFLFYCTLTVSRFFHFLWICTQSAGLLGRVMDPSQGHYLNTEQHKHRKTHTHTKHPCPKWNSNPRSQRPSERRQFMP